MAGQDIEAKFRQLPDFRDDGKIMISVFERTLRDYFKVSDIDASFIARCHERGGEIDVREFISEVGKQTAGNRSQAIPILRRLAPVINQR